MKRIAVWTLGLAALALVSSWFFWFAGGVSVSQDIQGNSNIQVGDDVGEILVTK